MSTCYVKMQTAILTEDVPTIRRYLNQRVNPYVFEGYNRSPMYWAMFYRKKNICRLFLDIEPEQLDRKDPNGRSVYDWADFLRNPYFRRWISQIHNEKEKKKLIEGFELASKQKYIITDISNLIIDYTVTSAESNTQRRGSALKVRF